MKYMNFYYSRWCLTCRNNKEPKEERKQLPAIKLLLWAIDRCLAQFKWASFWALQNRILNLFIRISKPTIVSQAVAQYILNKVASGKENSVSQNKFWIVSISAFNTLIRSGA